jgi:tetratricopeptide (TPR) repeat protein
MLQEIEEVVVGLSNEERIVLKSKLEIRKNGLEDELIRCSSATHAKQYGVAINGYTKLIAKCTQNALLLSNRGYCQYELRRFELALMDFATCLKFHPYYAKVHYRMANTYITMRLIDKALKAIQLAIVSDPGNEKYIDFYERTQNKYEQDELLQAMDAKLENVLPKITKEEDALVYVKENGFYIDWLSDVLQHNKKIALEAVKNVGMSLEMTVWQDDEEVVLEAIKQCPLSIRFASDRLKDTKSVALDAVGRNGTVLRFLQNWSKDPDIVALAVKTTPKSLKFASPDLKRMPEMILKSVKATSLSFRSNCPSSLRDDKEFMLNVIKIAPNHLRFASGNLRNDKDICLAAVERNGKCLEYVSDAMRSNRQVVITAMEQDRLAYSFADSTLQSDREILMLASPWFARLLSTRNHVHYNLRFRFE